MQNSLTTQDFFHQIAPQLIRLVTDSDTVIQIAEDKTKKGLLIDYSTTIDIAAEKMIVDALRQHYPDDSIMAEEGFSETTIPDGRIWIIDPICGTNNLGKGVNNFCTNIALADGGELIASCVVDHSRGEYYWSVGGNQVYSGNDTVVVPSADLGRKIDIDFGAIRSVDFKLRKKHNSALLSLINDTDFDVISLNSSLGFAYASLGKTDGFINVFNYPWDICASSFLLQQAGGVITGLDGSPWTITTCGAIGGRTKDIHSELLDLYLNA